MAASKKTLILAFLSLLCQATTASPETDCKVSIKGRRNPITLKEFVEEHAGDLELTEDEETHTLHCGGEARYGPCMGVTFHETCGAINIGCFDYGCKKATIMNANEVDCHGDKACRSTTVVSAEKLICRGYNSCKMLNLQFEQHVHNASIHTVDCIGRSACWRTAISNAMNVHCTGDNACYQIKVRQEDNDHPMKVLCHGEKACTGATIDLGTHPDKMPTGHGSVVECVGTEACTGSDIIIGHGKVLCDSGLARTGGRRRPQKISVCDNGVIAADCIDCASPGACGKGLKVAHQFDWNTERSGYLPDTTFKWGSCNEDYGKPGEGELGMHAPFYEEGSSEL